MMKIKKKHFKAFVPCIKASSIHLIQFMYEHCVTWFKSLLWQFLMKENIVIAMVQIVVFFWLWNMGFLLVFIHSFSVTQHSSMKIGENDHEMIFVSISFEHRQINKNSYWIEMWCVMWLKKLVWAHLDALCMW